MLGSQTAQLSKLRPAIATALNEDGRIVPIARLPLTDVRCICANRQTETPLSAPQIKRIAELADGHPLVLSYILNQVAHLATSALIDETLALDQPFIGDLARFYEERWSHLEGDDALVRLAGLLCRVRTSVELEWLAPKNRNDGIRFLHQVGHFFKRDGNGALSFFHDSLRQFLVIRTARTYAGKFSPEQDRRYHGELAELCGTAPQGTVFAWARIHHLEKSDRERELLALSSQEYFRQQFASLRPSSAIESDIVVGLRTAAKLKDARAVCGLLLAGTELTQRKHNIEPGQIVPMLIQLGDIEHAIGYLIADSRPIASREVLLSASIKLSQRGHQNEADRLLQMAEPWELLGGSATIDDDVNGQKSRVVRLYVLAALTVSGYSAVRDVVPRIAAQRTDSPLDDHRVLLERTTIFQAELLRYAIELLLKVGRAQEAAEVFSDLEQTCQGSPNLFLRCANRIVERARQLGQTDFANEWVGAVLRQSDEANDLDLHLLYSLAVLELKLGWPDPRLSRILVKEPEPSPYETNSDFTYVRDFEQFVPWLNHIYLSYAMGNQPFPQPLPADPGNWTTGSLESLRRAAHDMAALAGMAKRTGVSVGPGDLKSFLAPIIAFFSHWRKIQMRQHGRDDWMNAQHARRGLLVWALERACEIRPGATVELTALLSGEWRRKLADWDPGAARALVEVLIENGLKDLAWAGRWLDVIEPRVLDQEDAHTRVEEAMSQSEAWSLAGDAVRAKAALAKACAGSFGVGFRKDYQVDRWLSWLGDALVAQPEMAEQRINKLARWVAGMREYTDGWKPAHFAALALVRQVTKMDPSRAVALASWFVKKEVVWRDGLMASLIGDAVQENPSATEIGLQLLRKLVRSGDLNDYVAENLVLAFAGPSRSDLQSALKAAQIVAKPFTADYDGRQVNEGIARALVALGGTPADMGWKEWPSRYGGSHLPDSDLHLPGGKKLTQAEVLQQVGSGGDFIRLAEESLGANSGDFKWAPIIRERAHLLTEEHLSRLAQILSQQPVSGFGGRESSHALSFISSVLLQQGSNSMAADVAEKALAAANHHWGWNTWGDGGTCLRALAAMAEADPERAQAAAFRALAADTEADFGMCFYAAEELREIIPILDKEVPRHEIWPMVESLLSGLFELAYIEPETPILKCSTVRMSLVDALRAEFLKP